MILLLLRLARAEDIHAVSEGKTEAVTGPAVWMTEDRYTRFLVAEKQLPICRDGLDSATESALLAARRASEAYEVAKTQFKSDESLVADLTQKVALLAVKADAAEEKNSRLKNQRNVAVAVTAGFLVASVTATTLTLTN